MVSRCFLFLERGRGWGAHVACSRRLQMLASGFSEEECAMEKISEGWFGFSSGATKKGWWRDSGIQG